jgi:hypothetical protein
MKRTLLTAALFGALALTSASPLGAQTPPAEPEETAAIKQAREAESLRKIAYDQAQTETMVRTGEFFDDWAGELSRQGSPEAVKYFMERYQDSIQAAAKESAAFGVKDLEKDFDDLAQMQSEITSGDLTRFEKLCSELEFHRRQIAVIDKLGNRIGQSAEKTPEEQARATPKRSPTPPGPSNSEKSVRSEDGVAIAAGDRPDVAHPQPQSDSRAISDFVKAFIAAGNSGSSDEEVRFYGPKVNYFGRLRVDRDFIAKDIARYNQKWPYREFSIVADPDVSAGDAPGRYDVAFRLRFQVQNRSEGVGGTVLERVMNRGVSHRQVPHVQGLMVLAAFGSGCRKLLSTSNLEVSS